MASPPLEGTLRNVVSDTALKWIFVSGKGGCGKTTNSCALAMMLAATRRSVLLVSLDPAHNLGDAFNQRFSREPTRVNGFANLDAMEVEPPSAADLSGSPLSTPSAAGGPAGGAASLPPEIADLASAVPGIDEAMAFGTLMRSVTEMDYDVVVFDTAPTGHSLRLMSFPSLMEKALEILRGLITQFGPMVGTMGAAMGLPSVDVAEISSKVNEMEAISKQITAILKDRDRCTFICVCIAEFLSVFETERLVQQLGKFGINVRNIVVNQIIRRADMDKPEHAEKLYKARIAMQAKYLEQLIELYGEDFHVTPMPLLQGEVRGHDALRTYTRLLSEEKPHYFKGIPGVSELHEFPGHLRNALDENSHLSWIFVGGKGGVGKTTTSSSVAIALEAKGKKVLIVSTDPAHNLSDAFAQKISGSTSPTKLNGFQNLYALEVDPTDATEAYLSTAMAQENNETTAVAAAATNGMPNTAARSLSNVLPIDAIRQLVTSVPGIDEAVSFAQIAKLAKRMDFDVIVVDLAPTGHALRLLGFPAVADKALGRFESMRTSIAPMLQMLSASDPNMQTKIRELEAKLVDARRSIAEVTHMLTDQEHTTFICVAIAEFLSIYETERLVQQLVTMDINVRNIVCNQLLDPDEKDVMSALRTRSVMQQKYLDQIGELYPPEEFHIIRMPLLPGEVRGLDALKEYGEIASDPDRPL
jgi:arsenite/tail-anchored protein-transporting ATPase